LSKKSNQSWFHPAYAIDLAREVLDPLAKYYFRLQQVGLEDLPDPNQGRSIIFAANHAGRSFPWDGILLDYAVSMYWHEQLGFPVEEKPRALVDRQVTLLKRNFLFRIVKWWYRVGCVDATARNFVNLLKQGKHVIIFPEGVPGIARDFKDRYKLMPFKTPMLRLATKHNAYIIPVTIVGSEYFHPYANRNRLFDIIARLLKLPYLHLSPIIFFLLVFPFMYYGVLPAPVTIHFGKPIEPSELIDEGMDWDTATERFRAIVQKQLEEDRKKYDRGNDFKGLISSLKRAPEPFWKLLPLYWPHRFIKHARKYTPEIFQTLPNPWWFWIPILGLYDPSVLRKKKHSESEQEKS